VAVPHGSRAPLRPPQDAARSGAPLARGSSSGGRQRARPAAAADAHAGARHAAGSAITSEGSGSQADGGGGGGGGSVRTRPGPPPGWALVDARGRALAAGPPAAAAPPPPPPAPPGDAAAAAAQQYASLAPAERSMRIWRRVSPGMMPGANRTPASTAASAFVPYTPEQLGPADATHHLRKTDFSE
jgi:hypothetical protein